MIFSICYKVLYPRMSQKEKAGPRMFVSFERLNLIRSDVSILHVAGT